MWTMQKRQLVHHRTECQQEEVTIEENSIEEQEHVKEPQYKSFQLPTKLMNLFKNFNEKISDIRQGMEERAREFIKNHLDEN